MSRHLAVALTLAAGTALAGCKATVTSRTGSTPSRRPVAERHRDTPPPPPAAPDYAAQGWILLGEKWVEGRNDRDTIVVGGRQSGTWTKLMLAVESSDMALNELTVTYGNGQKQNLKTRHIFREGSRSAPLDLRGDDRAIKSVDLRYSDLNARDGRARVQLWGRAGDGDPTEPGAGRGGGSAATDDRWNPDGWDKIGEQPVNGKKDRVTFKPEKKQAYSRLMLVVEKGDFDMSDVEVTFTDKQTVKLDLRHSFKDGGRTRAIDLPGAHKIQKLEFKSSNVPGNAKGRVELWGKG